MVISSEIIVGMLSKQLSFKRMGNPVTLVGVPLPKLAASGVIGSGQVFVTSQREMLFTFPENSLIALVGTPNNETSLPRRCDIICFEDDIAPDEVLNALQGCIETIINWLMDISELASAGADIRKMIERSIPIFENSMTVTDYDLRVIGCCSTNRSKNPPAVFMDDSYERIPVDMTRHYIDRIPVNTRRREPFFFDDPQGHNYCVNLFDDDAYIGCCSLSNHAHEIQTFETLLFQTLASYVRRALIVQGGTPSEQISTMASIFSRLVRREQVPRSQAEQALELLGRSPRGNAASGWRCVVIGSANRGKEMPEGYVIDSVEEILPSSHAFFHEGNLVAFVPHDTDDEAAERNLTRLEPFLRDMNFRAGLSRPFTDVFSSYTAFRQALCALGDGAETDGAEVLHAFDAIAFGYMLEHSLGEFDPEHIIAPELLRLAALGPNGIGLEYIETLRAYLDNGCNGLRTAQATYLHRSTLAQRIERIRKVVAFDTAEQRLYLQMCLHLPGIRWSELARKAYVSG